ncbi:MAG: sulfurtransferase TusA family protein [Candidatus Krumholzibacteria bacterium]
MNDGEWRINAKGLSNPGPRLMVENALAQAGGRPLRVIVSEAAAAEDLKAYFKKLGRVYEIDEIGEEFHILVAALKDS